MFRWLPIITSCEEKIWSDDCRSWPREEKINNHGCWGKLAHIPDNDYWGICLFHVVWTNFFGAIILMWYTRNIYTTEHCTWTIIFPKEFKYCVTAYHLHYSTGKQNYLLSNILLFALKIYFERNFNVMQFILVKIKWHIRWTYLIQNFHDIGLPYYFKIHYFICLVWMSFFLRSLYTWTI